MCYQMCSELLLISGLVSPLVLQFLESTLRHLLFSSFLALRYSYSTTCTVFPNPSVLLLSLLLKKGSMIVGLKHHLLPQFQQNRLSARPKLYLTCTFDVLGRTPERRISEYAEVGSVNGNNLSIYVITSSFQKVLKTGKKQKKGKEMLCLPRVEMSRMLEVGKLGSLVDVQDEEV